MSEDLELMEMEDLEFEDEELEDWESDDLEADPFLGRVLRSPIFKKLARTAARTVGGAIAGPTGGRIADVIAGRVFREAEYEDEYESEAEFEDEFEAEGGDWEVLDEMEYMAEMAAETESEAEADEFLGAIANLAGPLISSLMGEAEEEYEDYEDFEDYEDEEADYFLPALIPLATSLLPKAMPLISKGIGALGRLFRGRRRRGRRRESEAAIKTLPKIVAKTVTSLKRQATAGKPITRKVVAATMARQTAKTLANPRTLAKAAKTKSVTARRVLPVRRARRLRV